MHYLFEPVNLTNSPLLWDHRSVSVEPFPGFYHWHQCCEILVVHEGNGTVIVDRKTYELRRGMFFFFQPFQLHKVYANVGAEQPYIRSKLHFDPFAFEEKLRAFTSAHSLFMQLWQGNRGIPAYDCLAFFDYVEQAFAMHEATAANAASRQEVGFDQALMLVLQLMHSLNAALSSGRPDPDMPLHRRPLAYTEQVMQWIEEHYDEAITLDDVADAMHLSKFHLSRLFQRETGSSIPQYVTARRIKTACRLLQTTDRTIERIGSDVGIPNPSYFIRLFKKTVGLTPLKYRKSAKL